MKKTVINKLHEYDSLFADRDDIILCCGDENYEKYYHLYEYTDELLVVDDVPQYPGLVNYLKTGVLTEDEFITACCIK